MTDNLLARLYTMTPAEINQAALDYLDSLLERCTVNLVSSLTGITRTTLYKWLDESLPLEVMSARDSAWLILVCETSPKVRMLLQRPPLSHPRMAKRLTDDVEDVAPAQPVVCTCGATVLPD